MDQSTTTIRNYFAKLDLEPELADLYVALHQHGPQTISELARNAAVERTRTYRLLGKMSELQLCERETQYKRSIVKPAPVDNLSILIAQREQQLRDLRDGLGALRDSVGDARGMSSAASRVQFYKGEAGVKQMLWNETRARTEVLSILYEPMQTKTRGAFFERWVRVCNQRGIRARSIVGDHFLRTLQGWYEKHANERLEHWQGRVASETLFAITHSMVIYNDVVCYYNWLDGEVFGVEIYNGQIAAAQTRFFEMLWSQSAPLSNEQARPLEL